MSPPVLVALVLTVAGASCNGPQPAPGDQTIFDFENPGAFTASVPGGGTSPLTLGTRYPVGTILHDALSGYKLVVLPFQWPAHAPAAPETTYMGYVELVTGGMSGGTGNEVHFNNACLGVLAPTKMTLSRISFHYGDHGGNENLIVNGQLENVDDFGQLPNPLPGLVNVTVAGGLPLGLLELDGDMAPFTYNFPTAPPPPPTPPVTAIPTNYEYSAVVGGGQELWVDDIIITH